jgi:hypothetical protein
LEIKKEKKRVEAHAEPILNWAERALPKSQARRLEKFFTRPLSLFASSSFFLL